MPRFVEQAVLLDDAPSKKSRRLTNEAGLPQAREIPSFTGIGFESLIAQIDMIGHTVDHIDIRVSIEECRHACDRTGIVDVIRIQPADDLAIGSSDSLVDSVGLAVVAFRDPSHAVAEPIEYSSGVVRAAAIEYDMFNVSAGLDGNALKGAPDELSLVEGWRYDADLHGGLLSANSVSR